MSTPWPIDKDLNGGETLVELVILFTVTNGRHPGQVKCLQGNYHAQPYSTTHFIYFFRNYKISFNFASSSVAQVFEKFCYSEFKRR